LIVQGTAANRAVFTSAHATPAAQDWCGININSTATGVTIDYAQSA
jgi:hypothetical protein